MITRSASSIAIAKLEVGGVVHLGSVLVWIVEQEHMDDAINAEDRTCSYISLRLRTLQKMGWIDVRQGFG